MVKNFVGSEDWRVMVGMDLCIQVEDLKSSPVVEAGIFQDVFTFCTPPLQQNTR